MSATSIPAGSTVEAVPNGVPLLQVTGLRKHFKVRGAGVLRAVDGVDLTVHRGEVLGLVGESGSGKSTFARCVLRLIDPTEGSVVFDGQDVTKTKGRRLAEFRRRVQPVFQDPYASLDPRWTVARSIREALDAQGIGDEHERRERADELLDRVGLSPRLAERRPHELSGGQRQRVGIAAALAPRPDLIVADEPVSALDVSVQAQVLNLVAELQRDLGLAIVFVAHDLAVVEHLCHRVAVMYLGRIVELGTTEQVFRDPRHPYTQALLEAIPHVDPDRPLQQAAVRGEIPSPLHPPLGCRFHPRCPVAIERCPVEDPDMTDFGDGHVAACHVAAMHAGMEPRGQPP